MLLCHDRLASIFGYSLSHTNLHDTLTKAHQLFNGRLFGGSILTATTEALRDIDDVNNGAWRK